MAFTSRALAFASRWFDPATVARIFEPLIADWQREWQSTSGRRRSLAHLRGALAFACAVFVLSPRILAAPMPASLALRLAARVSGVAMLLKLLLMVPFVVSIGMSAALFYLTPSMLAVVFPFALIGAVDLIWRAPGLPAHIARASALKLAAVGVLVMLTVTGWLVPMSNQLFRVEVAAIAGAEQATRRGLREMSTAELLADPDRSLAPARFTRSGEIRKELNNRAMLAVLPAMFVWLRWLALDVKQRRRFWPLSAAFMTTTVFVGFILSFFGGFMVEHALALKPGTGMWLPILLGAAIGIVRQLLAARQTALGGNA